MKPLERSSLVDRAEAAIHAGITAGRWKQTLPGVRVLSQALAVSPPTVLSATVRLIQKGLLISHGARKRLEIVNRAVPVRVFQFVPAGRGLRRVLCITDNELDRGSHLSLEIMSLLGLEKGWELRHRVLPVRHARTPRRQWDEVLATEHPDNLVVFDGTPVLAKWARTTGVPTVFAGGNPGDTNIPVAGVPLVSLMEEGLAELMRCGHRHICLPLCGLFPQLVERLRERMAARLAAERIPYRQRWHTPSAVQGDADVLMNALTSVVSEHLPTAIICLSWAELVTVECFLRERRLRVPADVSLLLLLGSAALPWFRPALTHFSNPAVLHARMLRRWIEKGAPAEGGEFPVTGKLIAGESVARPRR